jgi:hypothetical protein
MPTQSIVLVPQTTTESVDFVYSDKQKGDGYYNQGDGLHTVTYSLDQFAGQLKIQATLALDPAETDWFDVTNTVMGDSSTIFADNNYYHNFTGNFVWIRAAHQLTNGTIREIRYNH